MRVVLRVCPIAREPCVFGVRGVRAGVCRHQPLNDAAAWAWKRMKSAISTAVNYVKSAYVRTLIQTL
eukprot:5335011-Prymnesium_polylepis.1